MESTVNSQSIHTPKATRREWIGLAAISLPCLVYAMDLTVLNLALPMISTDLQPSSSQLLWILDIYGFFVAGLATLPWALAFVVGSLFAPRLAQRWPGRRYWRGACPSRRSDFFSY